MSKTNDIDTRILDVERQIAVLNLELIRLKEQRASSIKQTELSETQFDGRSLLNG